MQPTEQSRPTPDPGAPLLGAVAIGRNEGERLVRCLESLAAQGLAAIYVDSGSSDGSRERARALGAEVVELDLDAPFTAARARNAGFRRLIELRPGLAFVQFVDGDCELERGWVDAALAAMARAPDAAVVCGRRAERHPERSVYNRLCDLEWDTPVGEAEASGGDALMRRGPFEKSGGFDDSLIAGEEPELCFRLRRAGGRVLRIDAPMTRHDAAMTHFGQWWRRTRRSGHAAAELWHQHGYRGVRGLTRIAASALFWTCLVPVLVVGGAWLGVAFVGPVGLALGPVLALAALARLVWKVRHHRIARGAEPRAATLYGVFCAVGKLPEAMGVAQYWLARVRGQRTRLIEYKGAGSAEAR